MGFWDFLTAWFNVPFLIPLIFVLLFVILQLIGVGLEGLDIGGSEADLEVDADVDIDVDVDMDVDAEPDIDIDTGDVGGPGFTTSVLGFLNVGRVPLMIILMTWFASWGIVGLICNRIIGSKTMQIFPPWIVASLVAALVASIVSTKYLAAAFARIFPQSEPATAERDLIGKVARVTSGRVTSNFGRAIVPTPDGYRLTVSCRTEKDDEVPVQGDEVLLVDYDQATRTFEVVKVDAEDI
jgi:hypothetical protein